MHIYPTFAETIIKTALTFLSFVLSVFCYKGDTISDLAPDQTLLAFGGSVMMYGLSLMIEVCMLLDPKNPLLKKLVVGSIFVDGLLAMICGFIHIFAPASLAVNTTFIICVIPVVIYIMDFLLFYLIKPPDIQNGEPEDQLKEVGVEVFK